VRYTFTIHPAPMRAAITAKPPTMATALFTRQG
jgi:hypothetical protein